MSLSLSLLDAVKESDIDLVKELLQLGVDVNCVDEGGYTSLHWASIYNKPEIAHALLNDSNCEIDKRDKHHYTSVMLSIKHGHSNVLRILINYGANLNLRTMGGRIIEELAMVNSRWDIIQMLDTARKNRKNQKRGKPIKWEQGKRIGQGAFGQVYLCQDKETECELAVKCIKTNGQRLSAIEKQVQDLDNEIDVLRNLCHKNILRYYGFEKVKPSSMYIFMEYMPGGNMRDLAQRDNGLDEDRLRLFTQQIVEGIAYLHTNMVIHRDIKGVNILLDSKQRNIKVADFGLSKKIERCSMMSDLQSVLGSPYWMAPEVVKATACGVGYGRRADIWSIGCTMIEMLTTKPPFGDLEPMAAMYNIGSGKTLPDIPANASVSLKDFLSQCFKRDPKCRPSATDLLNHPFLNKERYASVFQESNEESETKTSVFKNVLLHLTNSVKHVLDHIRKTCRSLIVVFMRQESHGKV